MGEGLFVYYNGVDRCHRLKRGPKPPVVNPKTVGPTRRTGLARLPLQTLCGLRADHDGLDPFGSVVPGWDRAASGSAACACGGRDRNCAEFPARPATPGERCGSISTGLPCSAFKSVRKPRSRDRRTEWPVTRKVRRWAGSVELSDHYHDRVVPSCRRESNAAR